MGMSDCDHCWNTPCICRNAVGYRHLSINELTNIKIGIDELLVDKMRRGIDPNKREHDIKY